MPPVVRNISDTARWAAVFRAHENERPDAVFRDPFAKRLAGPSGEEIFARMPGGNKHAWSWVARTYMFDRLISEQVQQGADMVVNLAAGLDARPYRMSLPASLNWIEVDLPELLDYKEEILAGEKPVCALERVRLDLANVAARRELFEQLGHRTRKAVIVTEGLIIYLSPDEVASLATDLAAPSSFQRWVTDLASPALLRILQKNVGQELAEVGAPFKFGPAEGPAYFARYGWTPVEVHSALKTGARLKRLPFFLRILALLPGTFPKGGNRPWGGTCLLARP